jgi:hypothetical protein
MTFKSIATFAVIAMTALTPVSGMAAVPNGVSISSGADVYHGGGCRKSSPPGECCHMQTSTGKVHCH